MILYALKGKKPKTGTKPLMKKRYRNLIDPSCPYHRLQQILILHS